MSATGLRRGACPTLAAPMESGDGLLVRLHVVELPADRLAALAQAAAAFGNGLLEVTSRGSLQVRGLRPETIAPFTAALGAAGIEVPAGPPVLVGPLAGRDPEALGDPRPLAEALRGVEGAFAPKVSVIVDDGGAFSLDALGADVRLRAVRGGWLIAAGGTGAEAVPFGIFNAAGAVGAARALLGRLGETGGRTRDLPMTPAAARAPLRAPVSPVGRFTVSDGIARGFALPFGQAEAGTLLALAEAMPTACFRPAPGRGLIVLAAEPELEETLVSTAEALGFVTEPGDPRLRIDACAGKPSCASGWIATRAPATRTAAVETLPVLPPDVRLHLSGCAKRCAQPAGPAITILGTADGPVATADTTTIPDELRGALRTLAERLR